MVYEINCLKRKLKIGCCLLAIILCSTVTIFCISEVMWILLTTSWGSILCFALTFLWVEQTVEQLIEKEKDA